jgi:hypothetical protein
VQEALASGLPVVAPAAGGPLDLVTPDRTGYLVRPGDGDAIVTAVASLVADPVRRRHFGIAARTSVEGRTWAAVGDELIAHYRAAMGIALGDELAELDRTTRAQPVLAVPGAIEAFPAEDGNDATATPSGWLARRRTHAVTRRVWRAQASIR